jgi:hypothetical protein
MMMADMRNAYRTLERKFEGKGATMKTGEQTGKQY